MQLAARLILSPTAADGLVYVGSHEGTVYALNASMGMVGYNSEMHNTVVQSYSAGNMNMLSSPAVSGGTVYLSSYERQHLRAER